MKYGRSVGWASPGIAHLSEERAKLPERFGRAAVIGEKRNSSTDDTDFTDGI
jgi:hypothetical protein